MLGRGDKVAGGIIAAEAVTAAGERGADWKQVAVALEDWVRMTGRSTSHDPTRRRAYRMMLALEATGLFEMIGDTSRSTATRQRIRRISSGPRSHRRGGLTGYR